MKDKKFTTFSVPLGLLDYVNPVLYTVTMVTVIRNTYEIIREFFVNFALFSRRSFIVHPLI